MKYHLHVASIGMAMVLGSCAGHDRHVQHPKAGDVRDSLKPDLLRREERVANGKCTAVLDFDRRGRIAEVNSPDCITGRGRLFVTADKKRFFELRHVNESITFGDNTTTCYGPDNPSPPWCVCTEAPCP
jgi:hypothetical protein